VMPTLVVGAGVRRDGLVAERLGVGLDEAGRWVKNLVGHRQARCNSHRCARRVAQAQDRRAVTHGRAAPEPTNSDRVPAWASCKSDPPLVRQNRDTLSEPPSREVPSRHK
jgi:hypothetical protein